MSMKFLYKTKSVCPVCLKEIYADIIAREAGIYMDKYCPEHGGVSTLIWADNWENYNNWLFCGGINTSDFPQSAEQAEQRFKGLDFGCKACQPPTTAALMLSNRCNMNCPVCFTRDKNEPLHEPSLAECEALLRGYYQREGADAALELCGGEPTVRKDILELSALAREIGFTYIQLNTNGIKLAESAEFCRELKASGVTTVYLGFDGVTEKPYMAKYGRPMLETKRQAVKNCAEAGLAIVLVTCVIPGENDSELVGIIDFAKENMPAVKGIYLQPISYFGIYPEEGMRRITIPQLIQRLAEHEDISKNDFGPGAYEHAQCSFQAAYMLDKRGRLKALTKLAVREISEKAVHRIRKSMRATWLPGPQNTLTIGGMAFMDGWNIDLMRVQKCSVQIIQGDGKLIPLCSKYLSGCDGSRVFPGIG